MYSIYKFVDAIDPSYSDNDFLMIHSDSGKVDFRRYFATNGCTLLEFEGLYEMINFLNKIYSRDHYITWNNNGHGEIVYRDNALDYILNYFGTIKE